MISSELVMNKVATIEKDGYTLNHSWTTDKLGLQRNVFVIEFAKDGQLFKWPFRGDIRVSNISKGTVILGDDVSPYLEEEYQTMLREQVDKIQNT